MYQGYLEEYEEADIKYKEKIKQFDNINCLVKTNMGEKYAPDCDIYNIQGTRYFLMIKKEYWPAGIGDFVSFKISWFLKEKNKKEYKKVDFESVLDSKLISNKSKEDIIFNLNAFLTAY